MKVYILSLVTMFSLGANAICTATCDPSVSKPCGQVCISKYKNCHKPTTTACVGEAGRSTKKVYANPKKVEPTESKSKE